MSANGSKADIGNVRIMSALPPRGHCIVPQRMSALCQKRTSAQLVDHVVSAGEQRRRDRETEGLCCLSIDYKLVLGRCLHWKVGRLLALEDAINISRRPAELLLHF